MRLLIGFFCRFQFPPNQFFVAERGLNLPNRGNLRKKKVVHLCLYSTRLGVVLFEPRKGIHFAG